MSFETIDWTATVKAKNGIGVCDIECRVHVDIHCDRDAGPYVNSIHSIWAIGHIDKVRAAVNLLDSDSGLADLGEIVRLALMIDRKFHLAAIEKVDHVYLGRGPSDPDGRFDYARTA